MCRPFRHQSHPFGRDRGREECPQAESDGRPQGCPHRHPLGSPDSHPGCHDRRHPLGGPGGPAEKNPHLMAGGRAGGAPGGKVLAVLHHRAVAVAAHHRQGPCRDLVGREPGRGIGDKADAGAGGEFPPCCQADPPSLKDPLRVVRASVDHRAVPQIDAVVGVGDARSRKRPLRCDPVATCHWDLPGGDGDQRPGGGEPAASGNEPLAVSLSGAQARQASYAAGGRQVRFGRHGAHVSRPASAAGNI